MRVVQFLGRGCEFCGAPAEYEEYDSGMQVPVKHSCPEKTLHHQRQFEWELRNPSPETTAWWKRQLPLPDHCPGSLWQIDMDDRNREAITAAMDLVDAFQRGERGGWLYLYSPTPGTGKTTITLALALTLANCTGNIRSTKFGVEVHWGKKANPFWWDVPALFDEWKRSFDGTKTRYDADHMRLTECLLLDEFGNEQITKFTMGNLFRIVNDRYQNGRSLVLSGNYSPSELIANVAKITEGDEQSMRQMRAIADRIRERAVVVRLGGKSRR